MNQIFIKATAQDHSDGLVLRYSCSNGGAASGSRVISADTAYVNNEPIQVGDSLMFCEDEAGKLIGGFYPYGSPQGDLFVVGGGKGKGHLIDSEQVATLRTFPGQVPVEYGTRGRSILVYWINGIPRGELRLHKIEDSGINLIPNNQDLYFHVDVDVDGTLVVRYVSTPSKGKCDEPA